MGRKKVRYYQSTNDLQEMINEYFEVNGRQVIDYLLRETGFANTNDLWDYENAHCGFGCDWLS